MKREDNAILGEQAPNLVSQLRAGADHTASYPVQRLQVLLLDGFTRHEAHVRTANGFADRLCVVRIILLRLQIRLDELGSHQSHVVLKGSQHTPPVMRTPRSFHADQTGRQPLEEVGYLRSSQPPTKNGLSPAIHSVHLEHIFRSIESNYTHRDSHGTLLPRR